VNNIQQNEDNFDFFIGSTTEEGVNKPDIRKTLKLSDEWINYAGSKMRIEKIFSLTV